MTPFLQLIFEIACILLVARVAGYLSTRIGQPSVLGELLAGVLLGPSLLNLPHLSFISDPALLDEIIKMMGELGVLLLMFLAGLELELSDLIKNTRVSILAGTLGVVLPVALGWGVGELYGMSFDHSLFLGLTMGATSVSISAQTLMEMKRLRSKVGLGLLGAAVFDDILVILLLSTFLALEAGGNGLLAILTVTGRMVLFLGLSAAFGIYLLPYLVRLTARLSISQGVVTLALVVLLFFGLAAELLGGMAAITGTFLAGLFFSRTPEKARIESSLQGLAYAFFVPIFFISIGLQVNVRTLPANALWLMVVIILAAVLGKWIGAGLGARLSGFRWLESLQLGAGMISRGEVGLIVASVGLSQGLLTGEIFSSLVAMVLVSTLVTPPLLRLVFSRSVPEPATSRPLIDDREAE